VNVRRVGPGNVVKLTADGKPLAGNIVPMPPAGQSEVYVEAEVG
jgi:antitoxin (DNA-binding transcriptional repressor) of toxin-antitoxin stability system